MCKDVILLILLKIEYWDSRKKINYKKIIKLSNIGKISVFRLQY